VMRELHEQAIAYLRGYADSIPDYTANDDHLARVAIDTASAVLSVCNAITYGSAAARGPLIATPAAPTRTAPPGDPGKPQRFLTAANPVCNSTSAPMSRGRRPMSRLTGICIKPPPSVPV
jgi:hypothetical protein